jgi:hypothetical protein
MPFELNARARFGLLLSICVCTNFRASAEAATVLMVKQNSSLNSEETARKTQFESWGYTVTTIQDGSSQGSFDTAVAAATVVYVPCTVDDWEVLYKLRTATKGVVTETPGLDAEFGYATNDGYTESGTQVFNLINSHAVTNGLSSGTVTITSTSQNLANNNSTLAGGLQKLGERNFGGLGLGVIEAGGALANTYSGNSTASGRRVRLPWGWSISFSSINSNGRTILQNALAWAVGDVDQLVAHWKLDETSGTTAADATGNGHTGTVTGTANWTSAVRKNGFSFNGSTKIQASGLLNNPRNITVAAWVDLTAADSNGAEVISLGDHFVLRLDTGSGTQLLFYNGSTWTTLTLSQTFSGTGWHHLAGVFDDDELANSMTTSSSINYSGLGSNTVIGRHGNSATTVDFTGTIDDVRVYNYALSADEIIELYGLVGHWKFDEGSGSTISDSSPNANNAAFNTGTPSWVTGVRDSALEFNGANDADTNSTFDPPASGTVAFWYRFNEAPSGAQRLFGTGGDWEVRVDSTGVLYADLGGDGIGPGFQTPAGSAESGKWHHFVALYSDDDNDFNLYLDGELVASGSMTITDQSANILSFGARTGSTERFDGALDDFRVYNYELNEAQIAELYGDGAFEGVRIIRWVEVQ